MDAASRPCFVLRFGDPEGGPAWIGGPEGAVGVVVVPAPRLALAAWGVCVCASVCVCVRVFGRRRGLLGRRGEPRKIV